MCFEPALRSGSCCSTILSTSSTVSPFYRATQPQQQQPAAEAESLLVGTHAKKNTVRFEHARHKFKTRPDQWLQLSTAEGAVYLQLGDLSSGQPYWTWALG